MLWAAALVAPTLAAYEPSPTPTEEPLVWRWKPVFMENRLVETTQPRDP